MTENNDFRDNALSNPSLEDYENDTMDLETTAQEADAPIDYMSLDLASAMDELNHERDAMYLGDKFNEAAVPPVELNQKIIQNYIKQHGIASYLGMVRDSIWQAGYIKQEEIQLVHKKSGVYIKF